MKDKYYSQIETREARFEFMNHIIITEDCYCNKITLIDFPMSQYTLQLNGRNVMTAKNNIFDFSVKKSEMLKNFMYVSFPLTGNNKLEYLDRNEYINLSMFMKIEINYPKSVNFPNNSSYQILLSGYFYENKNWIKKK